MTTKKKYPIVRSALATASYANLNEPDTKGKFADGKYKVTLILPANDAWVAELEAKCREAAQMEWGKVPKNLQLPIRDGDEQADVAKEKGKDKEHLRGKVTLTAKTKHKPGLFDAGKNALPASVKIFSGDQIKVSMVLYPCKIGAVFAVALQLRAVQLIEKLNRGANSANDFDEEEGFTAEQSTKSSDVDGESEAGNDGDDL